MKHASPILVVDAHVSGQRALASLLEPEGYRLAFASNGPQALSMARDLVPDLVLLDVMMPGMDGFEVCRHLRANSALALVPVVMVTALADRASRLSGLDAGADDKEDLSGAHTQRNLLAAYSWLFKATDQPTVAFDLDPAGSHRAQIADLLDQPVASLAAVWRRAPESLGWGALLRYHQRPVGQPGGGQ